MTEAEFEHLYRETLLHIENTIEKAIEDDDIDLDYETINDILTLDCEGVGTIVITKQLVTQQLWLAARCGGFHFTYDEITGDWQCLTQPQSLLPMLEDAILQQAKVELTF